MTDRVRSALTLALAVVWAVFLSALMWTALYLVPLSNWP